MTQNTTLKVYKHTCIITGKSYIGQTKNLEKRTKEHIRPSSACHAFRNAIRKYGWNNFTTEILAENLSVQEANTLEEKPIDEHQTLAPQGYNLCKGGKNHTHSEETKLKISLLKRGKPRSEFAKQQMRGPRGPQPNMRKPKKISDEERAVRSERVRRLRTGTKHSEETKERMQKPHGIRPTIQCPKCQRWGADNLMKRWHFSNCKII